MLCGDFNIDLYKDCNITTLFLNTMYSVTSANYLSKRTRIADNSATPTDIFFLNEPCNFNSCILIFDNSDHFSIFFTRKIYFVNSSKNANKSVHFILINQNTLSALDEQTNAQILHEILDKILAHVNINEAAQLLFDRINYALKLSCHIRTKT